MSQKDDEAQGPGVVDGAWRLLRGPCCSQETLSCGALDRSGICTNLVGIRDRRAVFAVAEAMSSGSWTRGAWILEHPTVAEKATHLGPTKAYAWDLSTPVINHNIHCFLFLQCSPLIESAPDYSILYIIVPDIPSHLPFLSPFRTCSCGTGLHSSRLGGSESSSVHVHYLLGPLEAESSSLRPRCFRIMLCYKPIGAQELGRNI